MPPDAARQSGSGQSAFPGQPIPGPTQPSWPSPYPSAGGPPPGPNQPYSLPPGQQPAGYPPFGNQQPWGAWGPPMPPTRSNRRLAAILGGSIVALAGAGVIIAAMVWTGTGTGDHSSSTTVTGAASTAVVPLDSCPTAPSLSAEHAGYVACGQAAKDVGIPTYDSNQAHRKYTVTLKTNRGDVVFTATGSSAPYTVYSFLYLVRKQYFDNSLCHRLTTKGIYVLQCGDPTGTGTGGPGYEFQDENLSAFGHAGSGGSVAYPAGTVAMANAGYGTNGSQFFLVYRDTVLPPNYTPFGRVTQGSSILTSIASHGTDNSLGDGDGSPVEPVTIDTVVVSAS